MFSNLLFTMSLSGSIVFLLYILTYPFTKRYFSLKWRYRLLKIAAAFFLLPVPMCKNFILDIIYHFSPEVWEKASHISETVDMEYIVIMGNDCIGLPSDAMRMLLVVVFVGIVAFVIIQRMALQYWKWKTICSLDSEKPEDWEQELFAKVKRETGVKKDVGFVCSGNCRSPMASGVLSSILIFPKWEDRMEADKYEYMLKHELLHIKHHDLLIKLIGLLVTAVHWYNPLAYILLHEISVVSEMYCDSVIISGKGEDERKKYSNLILTLATKNEYTGTEKFFAGMANDRNKKVYKRRILEMKGHKRYKAVLPVIMTVFICMAGGMTALAYNSPITVSGSLVYDVKNNSYLVSKEETELINLPSDYFLTDGLGKISNISDFGRDSEESCGIWGTSPFHDYHANKRWNRHEKDEKGGCVLKRYEAFVCSKCHDVRIGKLYRTVTYKSCPHKYY